MLLGDIFEANGAGLLTAKLSADEVPPPGAGLTTVTDRFPAEATSEAETAAVSCVPLTNVVTRLEPFTCTTELFTKFEPFTVSVKAPLPATIVAGDKLASDATALLTAKASDALVPAPGVDTVMERDAAVASAVVGIVAVNCVLLTNVGLRFTPLTCTVDVLAKFVPVAVKMTGLLPTTAETGEIADRVGVTGVTVRFRVFEVQPPPSEFTTLNVACPGWLTSLALSCTLSCVLLVKVTGRLLPFN
jgi:hypothetical protein